MRAVLAITIGYSLSPTELSAFDSADVRFRQSVLLVQLVTTVDIGRINYSSPVLRLNQESTRA